MKLGLFLQLIYFAQAGKNEKCPSLRNKKIFYEGMVLLSENLFEMSWIFSGFMITLTTVSLYRP